MKKLFTLVFLILGFSALLAQNNYYVDQQNGADTNNGLSETNAFKTVEAAEGSLQPGDTLYIIGLYTNASFDPNYTYSGDINDPYIWTQENTIRINNLNGTESAYINILPYDDNTLLKGDGANILRISNSSYLRIEGFEIEGIVNEIPLSTALDLQFLYREAGSTNTLYREQPGTSDEVVEGKTYPQLGDVSRPSYTDTRGVYLSDVHHIDILNNHVHHTTGNGLRVSKCDYINIIGNEVDNCSRKSFSGTHGLVVTNATSFDSNDGHKIFILNNKVHHNYNEIYSWSPSKTIITPRIDEGKGISLQRNDIDDNDTPNDTSDDTGWLNGRILVANNLTYWNGFSGVHSNSGLRLDFINNTAYMNSYTNTVTYGNEEQRGRNIGISAQGGADNKIINNIVFIDNAWGGYPISVANEDNIDISTNMVFGINGNTNLDGDINPSSTNTIVSDPLFVNASGFNFNLSANSPAIDIAQVDDTPSDDYLGNERDSSPDLGALEYINETVAPIAPSDVAVSEINCTSVSVDWIDNSDDEDGFKIYQSENGTSYSLIETISQNTTTLTVNDLTENSTYSYKVEAFNSAGSSAQIESNSLTLSSCPNQNTLLLADSYVRIDKDANKNFGTSDELEFSQSTKKNQKRFTYLKFDVSSLTGSTNIILDIMNVGNTGDIRLFEVADDSWQENTITWNNAPVIGSQIGSNFALANGNNSIDITNYILNEANGDGIATIAIKGTGKTLFKISSKEGQFAPTLRSNSANQRLKEYKTEDIKMFPSPVENTLNINVKNNISSPLDLEVITITGQIILKSKINSQKTSLDFNFPSGIYIVKLKNEVLNFTKRIIKN